MASHSDRASPTRPSTYEESREASRLSTDGITPTTSPQHLKPNAHPEWGPGSADRVYPVRSIVSVDPSMASQYPNDPTSPTRGARHISIIDAEAWNQLQLQHKQPSAEVAAIDTGSPDPLQGAKAAANSSRSSINSRANTTRQESNEEANTPTETTSETEHDLVTNRFEHIATEDGHAIITGRDEKAFFACEDEPIHIPGAVQSFGAMVALREESDGVLTVRVVSENSKEILGYSPKSLFSLDSFCDILREEQADTLLDHIDFVRDESYDPSVDGPEVFILSIVSPQGQPVRFWCAIHISASNNGLIICEFELEDDRVNPPYVSPSDYTVPSTPTDTLGVDPTPEQLSGSTVNISQPLRILRNARRRRGEAAAMEVFGMISQIQDQLGRTQTLDGLLNTSVGIVKELIGFHRVMVYQFDSEFNGIVVAELVDPSTTKDIYKGLRFPAADIPKQARDLYRINKVRLLYDRDQPTSRLVCRTQEDLENPLDMTHSYMRAMSPIHIKYLANMGVRASMSISINGHKDLWGLISCHSYGTSGMRVSFPIRKMCRLIGDTVSRNIERLSFASRLHARKLINTVPADTNPSGYIIASSDDMLKLFDADYATVSISQETKMLGGSHKSQEIFALLEYLRMRKFNSVLASHNVKKDFPDLHYGPGFKTISGMLYVPLSTDGTDFIVFFRRGELTEIKWGGNPYEKKFSHGHLEPRKSFQTWKETVLDQCREWTESEVETAAILCLVYGKFIKVWRQNEAVIQGSQLTKLLLANSAHEVRTPLNAVINYLEIALEGALDNETRDNLTKSYSASKSLIYVINDLLDLTNAEKGQNLVKDESFDLPLTFKEATDAFRAEASRKGINYTVLSHPGLPQTVVGDQRRVRQAITNLIANAVQHTSSGGVMVEICRQPGQMDTSHTMIEMAVIDTGSGMSHAKLETLFQELEQISIEDDSSDSGEDEQDSLRAIIKDQGKHVLGLGLALASRIVRNMQGQLSVRSEEGKGSRFKISLQFSIPDTTATSKGNESHLPVSTAQPADPLQSSDEFVLVDGSSPALEGRRSCGGSFRSGNSLRSGKEPLALEARQAEPENSENAQRKSTDHSISLPPAMEPSDAPLPSPPFNPEAPSFVPLVPQALSSQESSQPCEKSPEISQASECEVEDTPPTKQTLAHRPGASASSPALDSSTFASTFRVLVAEDDPINGKILQKRLGKLGHQVRLTMNGEECAAAYRLDPAGYDIVLMDIQMPIIDGITSTKMIRQFEQKSSADLLSSIAQLNGRIPIFAVSASLLEKDAQLYTGAGFDGWILKPISFDRLSVFFNGLVHDDARNNTVYQPGNWKHGGWFTGREKK